jgi:hypothetical protein
MAVVFAVVRKLLPDSFAAVENRLRFALNGLETRPLTSIAQIGIVLKYRCFNGLSVIVAMFRPVYSSHCARLILQTGTGDLLYAQQ